MRRKIAGAAIIAMAVVVFGVAVNVVPTKASTVTDAISFSDLGIYATNGDPAPGYQGVASGSFNITFDPTQLYLTQSIAGVISNLTYSVTDPFFSSSPLTLNSITSFAYDGAHTLTLYSEPALGTNIVGTPDITIVINGWTFGSGSGVWFSQTGFDDTLTTSGDVSISALAETPLPAALPLFATALGVMGLFVWRKKRKTSTVIA